MAVKKATSAAKKSVRPTKAAATKASAAKVTAVKTTAKTTSKRAKTTPKTAKTTLATTKARATARPAKVTATTTKATAATRSAAKPATTRGATQATGSRRVGAAASASAQPQRLRVRENERPWTVKELAKVHAELESDLTRLQKEISVAELDLAGLMRDVGDGAGDDPADAGTATFEREQEISLANNAREVLEQSARALARLVDGSYGVCESCGSPIGKNRLLAFPRATLCLTCKSKQERR